MRRYLLALTLVLLLAADLGWKAWSERPYIVTGISSVRSGTPGFFQLTARYTLPNKGVGFWEGEATPYEFAQQDFWCWDKAEVGKRIPDCMRANWKVRTAQ